MTPVRRDLQRLEDMLEAISKMETRQGQGKGAFISDETLQVWMVHHIQIIGEAASKISSDIKKGAPDIPWEQIIRMRHVLVHDYFSIDHDEVWSVIERDIPTLKTRLAALVKNLNKP